MRDVRDEVRVGHISLSGGQQNTWAPGNADVPHVLHTPKYLFSVELAASNPDTVVSHCIHFLLYPMPFNLQCIKMA
jgi:hypothetical protein